MTININELRRLAQAATPGPDGVSLSWIKLLQDFQQSASPAVINELLDRLEEAESDGLEQARLNGMGSEREAELMTKLAAAETAWKVSDKSCYDLTEKVIPNLRDQLEVAEKDIAMKERIIDSLGAELNAVANERDDLFAKVEGMERPAPTALVGARKVTRDFRWDSATQCHVPTLKVEFEPVHIDAPTDAKGWQDQDRIAAMLEAAQEAKS